MFEQHGAPGVEAGFRDTGGDRLCRQHSGVGDDEGAGQGGGVSVDVSIAHKARHQFVRHAPCGDEREIKIAPYGGITARGGAVAVSIAHADAGGHRIPHSAGGRFQDEGQRFAEVDRRRGKLKLDPGLPSPPLRGECLRHQVGGVGHRPPQMERDRRVVDAAQRVEGYGQAVQAVGAAERLGNRPIGQFA